MVSGKTLRSDFSIKTTLSKELSTKYAVVSLERSPDRSDKNQKLTFLKKPQINAQETGSEKKGEAKEKALESKQEALESAAHKINHHNNNSKSLERKIANLHQQVEISKNNHLNNKSDDKKVTFASDKPQIINNQLITKGFTVSKVEQGIKRKPDDDGQSQDKRPSLEITLINPPMPPKTSSPITQITQTGAASPKRPPLPTIPLVRIKKSVNLNKSGISIIPKMPEKCDKIGALDLSKPNKANDTLPKQPLLQPPMRPGTPALKSAAPTTTHNNSLSNLQMLSKVATEHPDLLKTFVAKKPPIPNLQTLKIPVPQSQTLLNKLPKLNDINAAKGGAGGGHLPRLNNLQIRNMRPAQNQSIRNIPNPSLLVRQQNQNRINAMNKEKDLAKVVSSLQAKTNNNSNGNILVKGVDAYTKDECKEMLMEKSFEHKTVETVAN